MSTRIINLILANIIQINIKGIVEGERFVKL